MLHYPKMPGSRNAPGGKCWAFEKYDGTNLHFEWERDFGWHSFGARRDEFNLTDAGIDAFEDAHPNLHGAAALFFETLADGKAWSRWRPCRRPRLSITAQATVPARRPAKRRASWIPPGRSIRRRCGASRTSTGPARATSSRSGPSAGVCASAGSASARSAPASTGRPRPRRVTMSHA